MTREEALNKWVLPALQRTWNEKKVAEILEALEQEPEIKEAYSKGYKDGQEALAYHLELCKEEAEPCKEARRMTNEEAADILYKASRDLLVPEKYDEALALGIRALRAWDSFLQRRDYLLYKLKPLDEEVEEWHLLDMIYREYYAKEDG